MLGEGQREAQGELVEPGEPREPGVQGEQAAQAAQAAQPVVHEGLVEAAAHARQMRPGA